MKGSIKALGLLGVLAVAMLSAAAVWMWTAHRPAEITEIRVGVLPADGQASLQQYYAPLMNYLAEETGWAFKLVPAQSYEDLLAQFKDHKVDLVNFGGLTFIRAYASFNAVPLVMRDTDMRTTTYAVVKSGSPLAACYGLTCDALRDKRLLFGPVLSTSGHLMPRHFLKTERAIDPERFFSAVSYSENHRNTALRVRDGEADVGMMFAGIFRSMVRDGTIKQDDLHVVWETPPYPDSIWTVQGSLDEDAKTKLRDSFLALDAGNEAHAHILNTLRAGHYLPAATSDFAPLITIAQSLGLMTREDP